MGTKRRLGVPPFPSGKGVRGLGARLVPRTRRTRILGVVLAALLIVVAVFGYLAAWAAPPQRADAILQTTTAPVRDLAAQMARVSEASARQQTLYAQIPGGVSNTLAQQIRQNAQDAAEAAWRALDDSSQISFAVNSFGATVSVGWVPALTAGANADYVRRYLIAYPKRAVAFEATIRDIAELFTYSQGMALVMRDFLTYNGAQDLPIPYQPSDKETILFRAGRTLGALTDTIQQVSSVTTPARLVPDQERLAKEFVVARTLLAQIEGYVDGDNFQAANERGPLYFTAIRALQADLRTIAGLTQDGLTQAEAKARGDEVISGLVAHAGT